MISSDVERVRSLKRVAHFELKKKLIELNRKNNFHLLLIFLQYSDSYCPPKRSLHDKWRDYGKQRWSLSHWNICRLGQGMRTLWSTGKGQYSGQRSLFFPSLKFTKHLFLPLLRAFWDVDAAINFESLTPKCFTFWDNFGTKMLKLNYIFDKWGRNKKNSHFQKFTKSLFLPRFPKTFRGAYLYGSFYWKSGVLPSPLETIFFHLFIYIFFVTGFKVSIIGPGLYCFRWSIRS